ncbi:MAG: PEP-CTERM sorting domain-containing protein, partial [Pseudomonadota bacterium]
AINDGNFIINNGEGELSTVTLTYDPTAGFFAGAGSIEFDYLFTDQLSNLDVQIDDVSVFGLTDIAVVDTLTTFGFDLTAEQANALSGGSQLSFTFTGDEALDLALTEIRVNDGPFEQVPAPAALTLFGLGLAGIGAARRSRRA